MKVFILLSVVAVAFASSKVCGVNEHYNSCGTACPLTCDNYKDAPLMCNKMCNPGCHCDAGYVRSNDGRCVKPEECPARAQQCGENQHYESCGTACPLTCDNYDNPPLACILMCNPGCHCDEGYVKTSDGRCVLPEQCPAKAAQKACLGKPDPGMCKAYMPMWYYDIHSEKCHQFVYGGCQGNGNRYATEEECMNHCEGFRLKDSSANKCELPSETGLCRGYFPRYFFNKQTGQCEKFVYGGCGGNENNFATLEDCYQACGAQLSSANRCELPVEGGPCRGSFPRFFFDKITGKCEKFIYGGCRGNQNNFETEDVCNQVCGVQSAAEVCSLEAEVGQCRGYFQRYYFNQKTGRCQKFIYGGCGGNGNNFETIEECKNTCA